MPVAIPLIWSLPLAFSQAVIGFISGTLRPNVELSGLRGFLRSSARMPGQATLFRARSHPTKSSVRANENARMFASMPMTGGTPPLSLIDPP